jgi:DNA repair protein RecN (Recombination protein N)
VFQAENGIGTLIFDEIDTGVSGKVALAMGKKMHLLARDYQVLCITHLPSVALWADTHYRVSKEARQNDTITSVATLDEEQQIEELAIMANGSASKKAKESVRDLIREVRNG